MLLSSHSLFFYVPADSLSLTFSIKLFLSYLYLSSSFFHSFHLSVCISRSLCLKREGYVDKHILLRVWLIWETPYWNWYKLAPKGLNMFTRILLLKDQIFLGNRKFSISDSILDTLSFLLCLFLPQPILTQSAGFVKFTDCISSEK